VGLINCFTKLMRKLVALLILFAAVLVAPAAETNYFCVLCGKGPLSGMINMSKWGAVCDDCLKIKDRCAICGLPVKSGFIQTSDGRFICKFCLPNAVLDASTVRQIFSDTRRELVELFGRGFALEYPDVTINVFDVDYWSEKGRTNDLHKFGFASTRKAANGRCTHEVAMLSGRLRNETTATAAHEYTHLWINENRPKDRVLDDDTMEAICDLAAYKVMEAESLPTMQTRILDSPYTNGKIKSLVEIEKQRGMAYVLDWVKNGTTSTLDATNAVQPAPPPPVEARVAPPPLPEALTLNGLLVNGQSRRAIICGVTFAPGEEKTVKLRYKTVVVRCREIHAADVVLEVKNEPGRLTLKLKEGK
jgi:hypothetical protein